jgi:ubiquinone/menaquinone biosynthesis C-methylase UbiE
MSNAELFATVAREYATFRPGYPSGLFAWLARNSPSREAVWDCGCGSGQASVALAEHFAVVHATDVAAEQIAAATAHGRVRYSVAPAERSGLRAQSVDLVTVAQALHWFDVPAFYAEVARVARPGALLAVWTYPLPRFQDPELDRRFFAFYSTVVEQVTGYVSSWSATARYRKALGADPVPLLRDALEPAWPRGTGSVPLRMAIGLRVGVVS